MLWYTKPTSAFCVFKGDHPSQLQVEGLLPSIKSLRGGATVIDRVLGHRHRLGLERGPASVERRSASWAMEFAERIQGTEKESYKLPRREKPPQLNMVLGKIWENNYYLE